MTTTGPIVVLGFGRSGTTWLADILSKAGGGLVLFEPLHPTVMDDWDRFAYRPEPAGAEAQQLREHFTRVLEGQHRRPWLLRNHVPHRLEEMNPLWLDTIWNECRILGFKAIRGVFLADWLRREFNARIVHVVRHPAAVCASIGRRPNFWEAGWPGTWELFRRQASAIGSDLLASDPGNDLDRIATMWAVTVRHQLADADRCGSGAVVYEALYRQPFLGARNLLAQLGLPSKDLHPSWLFTPSMTTQRTLHGLGQKEDDPAFGTSAFWQGQLGADEVRRVVEIGRRAGIGIWDENALSSP